DPDVAAGRVGLYAWANPQAAYTAFTVETLERDPARWEPAFGSLAEFTITDAALSNWSATGGTLTQDETITDSAALGLGEYADLRLSATASGSGALLWRYADPG